MSCRLFIYIYNYVYSLHIVLAKMILLFKRVKKSSFSFKFEMVRNFTIFRKQYCKARHEKLPE